MIYAQSCYVYTVIPNLPCPRSGNAPGASHVADGIIGSLSHSLPYTQKSYGYP